MNPSLASDGPGLLHAAKQMLRGIFQPAGGSADGTDDRDIAQFSTWLPYRAWDADREVFILNGTVGFALELMPQSGADQTMIDVLRGLYASWPAGASLQITLFGTPHIQSLLSEYARQRLPDPDHEQQSAERGRPARNENLYAHLARKRYAHYLKGTASSSSIVRGSHFLLRDFRLVLSVTYPAKHDDIAVREDLMRRREAVQATLKTAGFPSNRWDASDLINWAANFCNPHRLYESEASALTYDPGRQLRDQIVDFDTRQLATTNGLQFHKAGATPIEARFYAVKSYPPRFQLWRMTGLIGDALQASLQYPCPFTLTMGVHFLNPADVGATTIANQARATQNTRSTAAAYMPDLADKAADWNEALRVVNQHGSLVRLYHTLGLFPQPEDVTRAESTAEGLWRDQGFAINNITFLHRPALLSSLPMTLSPALDKDLTGFRLTSTKSIDNAVALSPMIGEWRGSGTPVLLFGGRRGQVASLDFYDNQEGNYNAAIIGTPGSGKSVLLNEIAWSYLGSGATVWLLDLGKSFERLCRKAGGQWIELYSGCGVNLNPFTHVVDFVDDLPMLQAVVAKMAAPFGDLDHVQYQVINTAIARAWELKGKEMTITDVRAVFEPGRMKPEDPWDQRIADLALMLEPYSTGGPYAEFFDGPCNIDFASHMIVIEVEALKRNPALHRVALMILLFRITSAMYFTRDRRKLLIIDELKQQLGSDNDSVVKLIIEEAARRARKYGGGLITATHMVEDYHESPALLTAFTLSDAVFVLRQRKESVEMLAKSGKLSMDEHKKRLLQSLRLEKGAYSEIYAYTQMGEGVLRLIIDPWSLLMFSNRHEDNAPLDAKMARGLSVDQAIEELLHERGIES